MILYPIVLTVLGKKLRWGHKASELSFRDEREQLIVAQSTKTAYYTLIGGLITAICALGGLRFFSAFSGITISIYAAAIILMTALLDVAAAAFCLKWCWEYRK